MQRSISELMPKQYLHSGGGAYRNLCSTSFGVRENTSVAQGVGLGLCHIFVERDRQFSGMNARQVRQQA